MPTTIAFLNTAVVHEAVFNALLEGTGVSSIHVLRPELLKLATAHGITDELHAEVAESLLQLSERADVVVSSCSTLGPVSDALAHPKILRVDRPMMERAAERPPVLLALCLESTRAASSDLLAEAFRARNEQPDFRTVMCASAWPHFEAGDKEKYGRAIADAIHRDVQSHGSPGSVVLGQASMAAALPFLADIEVPILTGPELAVARALEIARSA